MMLMAAHVDGETVSIIWSDVYHGHKSHNQRRKMSWVGLRDSQEIGHLMKAVEILHLLLAFQCRTFSMPSGRNAGNIEELSVRHNLITLTYKICPDDCA